MSPRAKAFTLIEVMAVVLILGILATATVFSLAEHLPAAHRNDVLDRLAQEDAFARLAARRTGQPSILRFDLDDQRLFRIDNASGEGRSSHSWKLPRDFRVAQVLRPSSSADGASSQSAMARTDLGTADVLMNSRGLSETYALHLVCPAENPQSGQPDGSLWLVFAGLTGQRVIFTHEDEVHNLLAALGNPRPDAR